MSDQQSRRTRAVRAGVDSDTQHGAVMPPVYLTSSFNFAGYGEGRRYDYTRTGNPTRDALADAMVALEGGAGATVTGSGMSAIHLALQCLDPGDLLVAPVDCYGGTFRLLRGCEARGLFRVTLVDQTDEVAIKAALGEGARMLWVETLTNPLLRVVDLARVRALSREAGALMAVDNTFLSPALQRPLEFGADLVVHSTTKYLNGHSDALGGVVVAATDDLHQAMQHWANTLGVSGSPFDSYLTLRGIRSLHTRLQQHEANGQALAQALAAHAAVSRVHYPGLADNPYHDLARQQQAGFGGMLSFELAGGETAARRFLEKLELFSLAVSLGGVESLICHPPSMSHATYDEAALAAAGIAPGLLRISAGIEATDDLVADVTRALDAAG